MFAPEKDAILIVEDDEGIAMLEQRRLSRAGFKPEVAATARAALERIRQGKVALIVLDQLLPDQNGLEFYGNLLNEGHRLPAIVVTALSDENTIITALRAGVNDYVVKTSEYLDYLPIAVERVLRQVRLEKELADLQRRFQMVMKVTQDVIWDWDVAADKVWWSDAICTGLGYERDQVGSNYSWWSDHVHPEDMPALRRSLDEAMYGTQAVWTGEYRFRKADGSHAHFFDRGYIQRDAALQPTRMIGSMVDITPRKLAEVARRTSERQFRALFDAAADAIVVVDMEDRIRFWNPAAERLYGVSAAEALGQTAEAVSRTEGNGVRSEARQATLEQGAWKGEFVQKTRQGKEVRVASRWTLLQDEPSGPGGLLIINTDITEKRRLETQSLRAQRLESIGTLAGGIAHDLNNVLTPILMGVDLLRARQATPGAQQLLDMIRTSVERGAEMVKQVLAFARGIEGQRQPLLLSPLLNELGKLLTQTFPKSITVKMSAPRDLPVISGDATQLHQVVMNLCLNARDAMPTGGKLAVTARRAMLDQAFVQVRPEARVGEFVVIEVEDAGTGIPPEILDRVFDPFFTTKELGKGTGLGLSTALGIVKSHDGFMTVYSDVGKGTRFSVYLPVLQISAVVPEPAAPTTLPGGHRELILVVDDEAGVRNITREALEAAGYRVLVAPDGAAGVSLFNQHHDEIRLVVSDMMMPVMDGATMIQALRRLDPQVKIIACSGLGTGRSIPSFGLGEKALLLKPFTLESLLKTVADVLAMKS